MKVLVANSKSWFNLDKSFLQLREIKIAEVRSHSSLVELSKALTPDYIFVPHWNWRIPDEIVEKGNVIVFHTAPLPFGRGGSPIQNLIRMGYTSAPVNALIATSELDAGPIIGSVEVGLSGSLEKIFSRVNEACNSLMLEIIKNGASAEAQTGKPFSFSRLTEKDSEITGWEENLGSVYDIIRSVDGFDYPRAFSLLGRFKIEFESAYIDETGKLRAGAVIYANEYQKGDKK